MRDVIVLNPWSFKREEEVELYWLCSPYLNGEQNWMMKAVFSRSNGEIKEIEYPWGHLQLLRYGNKYKNGRQLETGKTGDVKEVFVPGICRYDICKGFDIPKRLYSMKEQFVYGNQKLCHFYVKGMNYYIPCIELVRSLLAPSKTLTNYIMKPHGLEAFIDEIQVIGNNLYIDFNRDYPSKMVNSEFVYHFVWLKFNSLANKAWNSVYNNVFKVAAGNSPHEPVADMRRSTYIEVKPPVDKDSRWMFRGITVGNSTLILELTSIQGLDMPSFEKVIYSHPSLYNPELVDEPKTKRNTIKEREKPEEYELDDSGESSKKDTEQTAADVPEILFGFNRKPKMIKSRKRLQKLRTGESGEERPGAGGQLEGEENLFTTQDWSLDGEIQPIEFKSLEVVKEDPQRGLEKFLKVIGYIGKHCKVLSLALTVVYLPYMNAFSVCPDGYRRTCAIVKVSHEDQVPCYIIEVGRPDAWSVSTLFMRPITEGFVDGVIEKTIYRLLQKLTENNGHWEHEYLQQQLNFRFDTAKHVQGQTILRWAERILYKM